jgi:hypothetical protein
MRSKKVTIDQLIANLQRLKEEGKLQGNDEVDLESQEYRYAKRVGGTLASIKRTHKKDGSFSILLSTVREGVALGRKLFIFGITLLHEE